MRKPEYEPQKCRLAPSVGAGYREEVVAPDVDVYVTQYDFAVILHIYVAERYQYVILRVHRLC